MILLRLVLGLSVTRLLKTPKEGDKWETAAHGLFCHQCLGNVCRPRQGFLNDVLPLLDLGHKSLSSLLDRFVCFDFVPTIRNLGSAGGSVVKNLPMQKTQVSIPGPRRSHMPRSK